MKFFFKHHNLKRLENRQQCSSSLFTLTRVAFKPLAIPAFQKVKNIIFARKVTIFPRLEG